MAPWARAALRTPRAAWPPMSGWCASRAAPELPEHDGASGATRKQVHGESGKRGKTKPMEISIRPPAQTGGAPGVAPIATSGLSGLARGGVPLWLPLPFLLTGALGAAAFGMLLPFVAPRALLAPDFPHVLALVHTATLGWLTMSIMGASLQLAPVILVSPLRAVRFARVQYPVYVVGVALLITGFWTATLPLLISGGVLVLLAVAHYVTIMGVTIARATTRPLTARYLVASTSYLVVVVSLG